MTPDRMRGWINKTPTGAKTLHLSVDGQSGMHELATWERAEIEETKGQRDGDVADALIAAAQEHTDGEDGRQKFLVQWKGSRSKPLKTVTHWATPKPAEEVDGDSVAPGISDATIIRDLLKALAEKDKALMLALPAYERTIAMLSLRLDAAYIALDERRIASPPEAIEITEQAKAESEQRQEAMGVLIEKLPDLLDLGVTAASKFLLKGSTIDATPQEH